MGPWYPLTALCGVCTLRAGNYDSSPFTRAWVSSVFVLVSAHHVTTDTDARINVGNADKGGNNEPDTEADDTIDLYASTLSIIAG